jgi:hypothetical protein
MSLVSTVRNAQHLCMDGHRRGPAVSNVTQFSGSTGKASSASSVYSDDTPHYTRTLAVTTSAPSGSYKANVRPGGGRGGAGYYNKAKSPKAPKASLANEEWDDSVS